MLKHLSRIRRKSRSTFFNRLHSLRDGTQTTKENINDPKLVESERDHITYWHEVNRLGEKFLDECFEGLDEDERDNIVRLAELRDEVKSRVWAEMRRALPPSPE